MACTLLGSPPNFSTPSSLSIRTPIKQTALTTILGVAAAAAAAAEADAPCPRGLSCEGLVISWNSLARLLDIWFQWSDVHPPVVGSIPARIVIISCCNKRSIFDDSSGSLLGSLFDDVTTLGTNSEVPPPMTSPEAGEGGAVMTLTAPKISVRVWI